MIGIFDSGLGGLTVVQALLLRHPNLSYVYFGDTARVPYGGKSPETIRRYALEAVRLLEPYPLKALIIACNTASSCAKDLLSERLSIPVIDVIGPGAEAAISASASQRIGVLATRATVASKAYHRELLQQSPTAQVFSQAAPLLVPLAEEGLGAHRATQLLLREYLQPLLDHHIDTLLLGCTHYPLLRPAIEAACGPDIRVVDSARSCAERIDSSLVDLSVPPLRHYLVSDGPETFAQSARSIIGSCVQPQLVNTEFALAST